MLKQMLKGGTHRSVCVSPHKRAGRLSPFPDHALGSSDVGSREFRIKTIYIVAKYEEALRRNLPIIGDIITTYVMPFLCVPRDFLSGIGDVQPDINQFIGEEASKMGISRLLTDGEMLQGPEMNGALCLMRQVLIMFVYSVLFLSLLIFDFNFTYFLLS